MRHVTLIALALLLIAPAAAAEATDVSGALAFGAGARVEGTLAWAADAGIADLEGPGARAADLSWSSARGYVVTRTFEYAGAPPAEAFVGAGEEPRNDTFSLEGGRLVRMECGTGCVLAVFARDGGTLAVEGPVEDPVAWLAEARVFSSFTLGGPKEDNFFYAADAGWMEVSRAGAASALPIDGPLTGSGALGIFARNATLVVETPDGEQTISAQTTSTPQEVVPGVPHGRRVEWRALVIELEDAQLSTDAWRAAYAPAPTMRLDGLLAASDVHGTLRVGSEDLHLAGDRLDVEGLLVLAPRARVAALDDAPRAAVGDAEAPMRGQLDGSATLVLLNGVAVAAPATSFGAVAVTTGAVAAIVLLLVAIKVLVLPLYTRIDAQTVLKNPNRRTIYEAIGARPGLTTAELARTLSMTEVVVRHHLRMLEAHRLIVPREHGRLKAFFAVAAAPATDTSPAVLSLKDATRLAVARAVAEAVQPPSQAELVELTGLSQRLLSHHLLHLEKNGLVDTVGSMPKRYVALAELHTALQSRVVVAQATAST